MSLPYSLRLLCLCLSSFFLVHVFAAFAVSFFAPRAIRLANGMGAKTAANWLFTLRLLPVGAGLLAVLGFCIPSYLWLEPRRNVESVGLLCLFLAIFGAAALVESSARMLLATNAASRFGRPFERSSLAAQVPAGFSSVCVLSQDSPLLAVAGVFRPRLLVSTSVLRALLPDEWNAALLHERAHRIWRDNLKRFLLLSSPRPFFFGRGLLSLVQEWSKFAEWAADDLAVGGDPNRAVSLAAALVRVARLGSSTPPPALVSSLAGGSGLSERVERLLRMARPDLPSPRKSSSRLHELLFFAAGLVFVMLLWPASLFPIHLLLERLLS